MWNQIKSWFSSNDDSRTLFDGGVEHEFKCYDTAKEYEFKWYEPGEENPLPVRVLDVRDLTWNIVATTSDEKVAESFNRQRKSDGREYINAEIPNPATVQCNLVFPHNGDELEGIIYKADSMDIKWDIYIYDATFLFVRSWTGQLQYRAFAEITDTNIRINQIQTAAEHIETAPQAVYFILGTHALGRVLPHTIPANIPNSPEQIGLLSFNMYGPFGCYATYEDITQIEILRPESEA